MSMNHVTRRAMQMAGTLAIFGWLGALGASNNLDPSAISIQLPKDIKWVEHANKSGATAVLHGDPSKPELYVLLEKWYPHNNSRPHFHQNDRYITVLSGTWWVNTGPKYDMSSAVPLPAGSYVTHFAKTIHYDGAKEGECILEIVGMGPAQSTPAEAK